MKLIFIYGPPASGKLTIANKLSKLTGFKLFDNHKVIDMFSGIADMNNENFWDSADRIKLKIIEESLKLNVKGLIFTMVYTKNPQNHVFPRKIKRLVEKYNGEVCFVRLKCSEKELLNRVSNDSRKKYKKIVSKNKLSKFMKEYDVHGELNFNNKLDIDVEKNSVNKSALMIKDFFKI